MSDPNVKTDPAGAQPADPHALNAAYERRLGGHGLVTHDALIADPSQQKANLVDGMHSQTLRDGTVVATNWSAAPVQPLAPSVATPVRTTVADDRPVFADTGTIVERHPEIHSSPDVLAKRREQSRD